jgi:HEAT repeat protein
VTGEEALAAIARKDSRLLGDAVVDAANLAPREQAIAALTSCLRGVDFSVAADAAWQLGRLKALEAVPQLVDLLRPEAETERGITGFPDPFGWYEPVPRTAAAEALGMIGAKEAIPALAQVLDPPDPDPNTREAAIKALLALGSGAHVTAVLRELGADEPLLRDAAVEYLARFGDRETVLQTAEPFLANESETVRRSAESLHRKLRAEVAATCPVCGAAVPESRVLRRETPRYVEHVLAWEHIAGCGGCLTLVRMDRPEKCLAPSRVEVVASGAELARAIERLRAHEGESALAAVDAFRTSPVLRLAFALPEVAVAVREWLGEEARLREEAAFTAFFSPRETLLDVAPHPLLSRVEEVLADTSYSRRILLPAGTTFEVAGMRDARISLRAPSVRPPGLEWGTFVAFAADPSLLEPP